MSKYSQRQARNAYGLNNPQVGDAWNERYKWLLLVLAVKPKTPLFPEMIVCCQEQAEMGSADGHDRTYWAWDVEERVGPLVVFTDEEYRRYFSYSSAIGTWADVEHNKFRRFVQAVDPAQIHRAIARKQWDIMRQRIRSVLWPF